MFLLNPTKEPWTLGCGGVEVNFPIGEVVEVSDEVGKFLLEPRGELAAIPHGGTTWYGLVPVRHDDKIEDVAKRGLKNYRRLLIYRLQSLGLAIQEAKMRAKEADQEFSAYDESMLFKEDGRKTEWEKALKWVDGVLAGKEKLTLTTPDAVQSAAPPAGVKVTLKDSPDGQPSSPNA